MYATWVCDLRSSIPYSLGDAIDWKRLALRVNGSNGSGVSPLLARGRDRLETLFILFILFIISFLPLLARGRDRLETKKQ